jgi:thiol:disulfide interchange protein DsbD
VTSNSDTEKALTKQFGLFGPPGILFFDEQGTLLKDKTLIGYKPPEAFLEHLRSL